MATDHYETLGIPRTASPTQVTLAFFERVREQDRDSDTREFYKAYEVLSNTERRRAYDAELAAGPQDATPSTAPPPHSSPHPGAWPKGPSGAPVQPGRAPSRPSYPPPPARPPAAARPAGPSSPYGVTGSPYLLPPGTTQPRVRKLGGLVVPRGWAMASLVLLAVYFAFNIFALLFGVLAMGVRTEASELVAMLVMLVGFAALMAWGGLRQVRSRKRENGYIACVAVPSLFFLGAVNAAGAAAGGAAAIYLLTGLVLYVLTVELWRRQQLAVTGPPHSAAATPRARRRGRRSARGSRRAGD